MSYVFNYTKENGWEEIKVPRKDLNKVFKYRKISFLKGLWSKRRVFYNPVITEVVMIEVIRLPLKALLIISSPLIHLIEGLGNFSETNNTIKRYLNQEKYGAFSGDNIWLEPKSETQSSVIAREWVKKYSKSGDYQ